MKPHCNRAVFLAAIFLFTSPLVADDLEEIGTRGFLVWGGDQEGGGPYVYPDPADPRRVTGFEVELGELLAGELQVKARFFQGSWDNLPALLFSKKIDIILNGYELTPARDALMERTDPYYIYDLVLLARHDSSSLGSWEDLRRPAGSRKPKVGVLVASAAHLYMEKNWRDVVEIVTYEGNTDAMREVETGKLDATLQDGPIAIFYRERFPDLKQIGEPVGQGYYVIYLRKGESSLRDALNSALRRLLEGGELRRLYEKYGLWSPVQEGLLSGGPARPSIRATSLGGWAVIRDRGSILLEAAGMTVFLSVTSMPLAIIIGLLVAIGRLYGPRFLRWMLMGYVEFLRGTPLMLQLFVIFFLLPEIGIQIPALAAAILGLAINYSAYEAEIYRAGLQAIPAGQMEAALALGMSRGLALRRIIVPQAVRIVIPPVTNDFIALFKDTSVCSVITVMELTKQYSVQRNETGATIELAALTALLYLLMSLPLARLASWTEKKLGKERSAGAPLGFEAGR